MVIDTGVEYKHPALAKAYRGLKEDGSYDHNYNWLQTYGGKSEVPIDDHSHGSHCSGTILGKTEQGHTYGVAPKAKLTGCKFLSASGSGTLEAAIACLQFALAPTDLKGKNADVTKRPHVTSNSWGAPSESKPVNTAIDALVAAGIMVVAAAGNSGPRCSSVGWPGGHTPVFTVGALEVKKDNVTSFSARGPVKKGMTSYVKPDITAPGRDILSAMKGGGYGKMSGTSMACPHVAGGVALVWSAIKDLKNKVPETIALIQKFARHVDTTECSSKQIPNNVYGYGTMQLLDAIKGHGKN
jgi:subtilisin family serine protease